MSSPAADTSWADYVEQRRREATDVDARVALVEFLESAVRDDPHCLQRWIAYCEYFWSLYAGDKGLWASHEELETARQVFTLDAALDLWRQGYEAVQYRLADSHELWDRWIAHEMELLARIRTEPGVQRITQLFKNRLLVPHATWDQTSEKFSSFLSQYNQAGWEDEMQLATQQAREAKRLYDLRDRFEMRLRRAACSDGGEAAARAVMAEYLQWEIHGTRNRKDGQDGLVNFRICLGLFARALTGPCAADADTWMNFVVLISGAQTELKAGRARTPELAQVVPNMLDTLKRAVRHVPWSGSLWARYILAAEEAGLSFTDIESIKHAATNSPQLDRDGMTAVLEMYAAWCAYLKRTAMHPHAPEEDVDLAEVGLPAALEDVKHWGRRRYGDAYQGDPAYRLEKMLIQFLTEKKDNAEAARAVWQELAALALHANSHDFWLQWYTWEMVVFWTTAPTAPTTTMTTMTTTTTTTTPTATTTAADQQQGLRVPTHATQVFYKALQVRTLDWPERILDMYLQHCRDYEVPDTIREGLDTVYKTCKGVAKRREREARMAAEAQAQAQAQAEAERQVTSPSPAECCGKRKRPGTDEAADEAVRKRARNTAEKTEQEDGDKAMDGPAGSSSSRDNSSDNSAPKRDREHTSVFVSELPADVTEAQVRQFFREYGAIQTIDLQKTRGPDEGPVALVEFQAAADAATALLRDGKRVGDATVRVTPAVDCTLWVTNYPAQADEAYIRALFGQTGHRSSPDPIHSVRFPSRKYNAKRRFCYVTFRSRATAAEAAARLHGQPVDDGRFRLQVKLSDPGARQSREGALAEGRALLRDPDGQPTGTALVAMETRDPAEDAVAKLDKVESGHRIMTVEMAKPVPKRGEGGAAEPEDRAAPRDEENGVGDDDGVATGAKATGASMRLMPRPAVIRRPQATVGKRRGPMFAPVAKKTVAKKAEPAVAGEATSAPRKKTNADFKQLFVASASATATTTAGGGGGCELPADKDNSVRRRLLSS